MGNSDMERCLDLSLEAAKEEFAERFMMYFRACADSQGVVSEEDWKDLKRTASEFSKIDLGDKCLHAGEVTRSDFVNHVDVKLEEYFDKLKRDALEVQQLKVQIWAKEVEVIE